MTHWRSFSTELSTLVKLIITTAVQYGPEYPTTCNKHPSLYVISVKDLIVNPHINVQSKIFMITISKLYKIFTLWHITNSQKIQNRYPMHVITLLAPWCVKQNDITNVPGSQSKQINNNIPYISLPIPIIITSWGQGKLHN